METTSTPIISDRLALSAKHAAALVGVSLAQWLKLLVSGRTPLPVRLGTLRGTVRLFAKEAKNMLFAILAPELAAVAIVAVVVGVVAIVALSRWFRLRITQNEIRLEAGSEPFTDPASDGLQSASLRGKRRKRRKRPSAP